MGRDAPVFLSSPVISELKLRTETLLIISKGYFTKCKHLLEHEEKDHFMVMSCFDWCNGRLKKIFFLVLKTRLMQHLKCVTVQTSYLQVYDVRQVLVSSVRHLHLDKAWRGTGVSTFVWSNIGLRLTPWCSSTPAIVTHFWIKYILE